MIDKLKNLVMNMSGMTIPSVDIIMKNILERKIKAEEEFLSFLKKISV